MTPRSVTAEPVSSAAARPRSDAPPSHERRSALPRPRSNAAGSRRLVLGMLLVPFLVATLVRVAPLIEGGDRLQRQCVTEDGYLMLTIARNIALGNGLAVSAGEISTNGTQPLATLLYAGCFRAVGGDRIRGLYLVTGVQLLTAIATALLLYWSVSRCFYHGPHVVLVALLAASFWFMSPSSVMHSQNGLETGLATLLIICALACYDRLAPRLLNGLQPAGCLALGSVLGLTFLARNDACLLVTALLLVHLYRGKTRRAPTRLLAQCFLIGATSIAVASPWLWFNVTRFGHLMPVSGRSQSLGVGVGANLLPAFVALAENASLALRIPGSLEQNPTVVFASIGAAIVTSMLVFSYRKALAERFSAGAGVLALYVAGLFVFYALFFGMPSFLGRYLFPVVALSAVAVSALMVPRLLNARSNAASAAWIAVLSLALFATIALNARIYRQGTQHMHFQVVDWVRENVPPDTWVAAVQTGTLGFYHDRTINLDGKVNPEAYEFRAQGRIPEYVVERNVTYIVDWASIASWANDPAFATHYELILKDESRGPNGIAVLRRRAPAGTS